jgi:HEPN domain-containing protein
MIAQQLADLPADQFKQVEAGTATVAMVLREIRRGANTKKAAWSLESVDQGLRKAINALIIEAPPGSQHDIADLLRRLADELDEAARPELRDAVSIARDELDLHDAEPGGSGF